MQNAIRNSARRAALIGAAAIAALLAQTAAAAVTIEPQKTEIVSCSGSTRLAAEELQLHLEKITGVAVPVRPKATPGAYSFRFEPCTIGENKEACEWKIGEDGAVFRGDVYLAVIDFLEDSLGVRWPGGDVIIAPSMNPIVVTATEGAFAPLMTIREIRHKGGGGNSQFARRMRAGRHDAPAYGHAFTKYWGRFGATHPEFFALRKDGLRAPRGVTEKDMKGNIAALLRMNVWNLVGMCVSSTGFQAQVIADWRAAGMPQYINLCENDIPGRESCQCDACKAHDAPIPPGADMTKCTFYTDRYVWFGNEILRLAREFRPDVKVSYYAYNGTEDPPRRYRPDPDSVVGIVPTTFTYEAIDNYVGAWKKGGLNHFFYRPNRHYYYSMCDLPPGYEEHFFNVFQRLAKAGCIGFDYDSGGVGRQFMCWLDSYVLYHAMNEPEKQFSHWEDHYFTAFGAAKEEVRDYYRFWREQVWNARIEPNLAKLTVEGKWYNVARGIIWKLGEYYRTEDFDRSAPLLAAAAAKRLTPDQADLVARLQLCHQHGRFFVDAVANKCEANTRRLVDFRDAHGFSRYAWAEQYYGDVTGVEAMFGPQMQPKLMRIVSSSEQTASAAEALRAALELITGVRPEIVPSPIPGHHNFFFEPLPDGSDPNAFAWAYSGNGTRFSGNCRAAVRDYLEKALGVKRGVDGKMVFPKRSPLYLDVLKGEGVHCPFLKSVTIEPAKAVIVSTGKDTKGAAEELKCHLDLIGGTDVPIVAKVTSDAYVFQFDTSVIDGNMEACAWVASPTGTTFRGNAYFAVVDFLENSLGVRWPDGDAISYVEQNPIVVTCTKGSWAPELRIRAIRGVSQPFARRMRTGRHDAPSYGHAFTKYWAEYGKDHPEYFAMRTDGLRGPKNAKPDDLMDNIAVYAASSSGKHVHVAMCCTSTGLVNQIVENWLAAGKHEYINLCENDVPGQDSCQCPACKALDVVPEKVDPKWETHYADRYVYFGNQVLEAARRHRADVKVCYYAYNATQDAPRREKPDSAAVAGIVPTYFSDSYIADYVGAWKKAGLAHFFYRPNRHGYYSVPYLPFGAEKHFFGILKYLVREGSIAFDYDCGGASKGGFEWFERYVLFHAMQDPSKPFSYWEDHFCSAYGAAKEDVKAYYRYWREEVWEKRLEPHMDGIAKKGKWFNFGRGLMWNLKDYYNASDFDAAEKSLKSAEAKNLAKPQNDLVRRLRVAHDHARVFFEAVAHKSKANTEALVAYRKAHGYPLYRWSEQYFGDITGVEKLLGPEKKDAKTKK